MTFMWDSEPVVAPSDFCPFTKEVAMPEPMPVAGRDASTRVRAALKGGAVTRPVRRNLLELGLAHGQGAAELEAAAVQADALQREADRAAGVDGATPADETREAEAAGPPDPAALEALATEIRDKARKRERLAEELAGLDRERAELQAKLMQALGKAGLRSPRPAASAPPALPATEYLPKAAWR